MTDIKLIDTDFGPDVSPDVLSDPGRIRSPRSFVAQTTARLRCKALFCASFELAEGVMEADPLEAIAAYLEMERFVDAAFAMTHHDEEVTHPVVRKLALLRSSVRSVLVDRLVRFGFDEESACYDRTIVVVDLDHAPIEVVGRALALDGVVGSGSNVVVYSESDDFLFADGVVEGGVAVGPDMQLFDGSLAMASYVCGRVELGLGYDDAYTSAVSATNACLANIRQSGVERFGSSNETSG